MPFFSDFGILTVVPEAWAAAIEMFGCENFEDELGIRWGVALVDARGGGQHVVAVGQTGDRSNVPAADTASTMLRACNPRYLVVADIGAGFWGGGRDAGRDGLMLGDVVVANDVQGYEVVKEVEGGGILPRDPAIQLPATGPRHALRTLDSWFPDWHDPARSFRPDGAPERTPQILDGPVVSGEKLLSDPSSALIARLVRTYDKALALDMESAGIGRAILERQNEEIFAEFTVLRGISDFADKKQESNQKTRDNWKPYAARAAVAASRAWIGSRKSTDGVIAKGKALPPSLVQFAPKSPAAIAPPERAPDPGAQYLERLRPSLPQVAPLPDQGFALALKSTEHRAINPLIATAETLVERGALLSLVLHDRKVIVVGPSGAGKSYLLAQVLRQAAAQEEPIPVYLDLKGGWRPDLAAGLTEPSNDVATDASMNALLTASALDITTSELARISESKKLVIIVDGINEVPADVARLIRRTLDQYVRFHQNVRVLASDRRIDMFYRESRWTALHLSGATESEARNLIDGLFGEGKFDQLPKEDRVMLRLPFFLDRALRSGKLQLGSRARAVDEFLRGAGFTEEQIDRIAPIAFGVYQRGEIGLNNDDLTSLEQDGVLTNLRDAVIVIDGASGAVFSHQLVHQFLAGRYLAEHPDKWTFQILDRVTADAASLDTVGMTIASISDEADRDRFLRIVYDWNWWAAVLALIESQNGERKVSEALSTALLALAAQKRFDPVISSSRRVDGLLDQVPGPIAQRMREVGSHGELLDQLSRIEFPEVDWWAFWLEVFLWTPERTQLTDREIALIGSPEPLIGWTIANSLRRFACSEEVVVFLRTIYRSQLRDEPGACATRWRVVHALGVCPTAQTAQFLFETLDDSYAWVVKGAVRSLVETAALARDKALRSSILEQLGDRWSQLGPAPLGQILSAAFYRDTDPDWPNAVRPLLESIRNRQTGGERERWDRRIGAFESYVDAQASE